MLAGSIQRGREPAAITHEDIVAFDFGLVLSAPGPRLAPALLGDDRLHPRSRARGVLRLLGGRRRPLRLLDHRDLGRSDDDAGAVLRLPRGGAASPFLDRDDRAADADADEPLRVPRGFAGDTSRAAALRAEGRAVLERKE